MIALYPFTPWHAGAGNGAGSIFADQGRMRLERGGTTLYPIATLTETGNPDRDRTVEALIATAPTLAALVDEAVPGGIGPGSWDAWQSRARKALARFSAPLPDPGAWRCGTGTDAQTLFWGDTEIARIIRGWNAEEDAINLQIARLAPDFANLVARSVPDGIPSDQWPEWVQRAKATLEAAHIGWSYADRAWRAAQMEG